MRFTTPLLATAFLALGGIALAQQTITEPTVEARSDAMKTIGASMKALSDMAGGKAPFDAATARETVATFQATAAKVPALFEPQATDPASKASPKIWQDWAGFTAAAAKLKAGADAIDPSSAQSIGATIGGAGGTCRACHTEFRI